MVSLTYILIACLAVTVLLHGMWLYEWAQMLRTISMLADMAEKIIVKMTVTAEVEDESRRSQARRNN